MIYSPLSQALRKAFLFPANARQSVYASGACDKELETNRLAGFCFGGNVTREIQLTRGKVALVDDEDFDWLNQWKWYAQPNVFAGKKAYAQRTQYISSENKVGVMMHRLIMGATRGLEVDHINGDGLDNRRCNLRLCTRTENARNLRKSKANTSGYKGVSKYFNKWQARLETNGKQVFVGLFPTIEEAARAYDAKAKELFGEFAGLNFPNG
jgi:hypothetical protein